MVYDGFNNLIWDQVAGGSGDVTLADLASTAAGKGSKLVAFIQRITGAVARWVEDKLGESVSAKDFGTVEDGVTDDSAALLLAMTNNPGRTVVINGTCLIKSIIDLPSGNNASLRGRQKTSGIKASGITVNGKQLINYYAASDFSVRNLTIDFNDTVSTVGSEGCIGTQNCSDFDISDNKILNIHGGGIVVNGGQVFSVCRNYILKSASANTYNQSILVSSSSRHSSYGDITSNHCHFSGMDFNGLYLNISYNRVWNWAFGGGITMEQDSVNCNYNTIHGNILIGSTGTDVNSTNPPGIENWSFYTTISGNVIASCSGSGIDQGGGYCTVTGNVCFNNGQVGGSGITSRYGTATYQASGSTYTGNKCFDTQSTKTQAYGYTDQSASLARITLAGNDFNTNKTGGQNILGSLANVQSNQLELSYTVNPGTIANGASGAYAETFAGAALGDYVIASFSADLQSCSLTGYVPAANAVVVVFSNTSGGSKTFTSGTVLVRVIKPSNFTQY